MRIVKPLPIMLPMILANSCVDKHPAWADAETCIKGVFRTHASKTWMSLKDGNQHNMPGLTSSTEWWSLVGSSNSHAMFDDTVGTQSEAENQISFRLRVGFINSLTLHNMVGKSVTVTAERNGTQFFTKTVNLWNSSVMRDWEEYYYSEPQFVKQLVFDELRPFSDMEVTVTINNPGATCKLGLCVVGRFFQAGLDRHGIVLSGTDYTVVYFDKFGNLTLEKQAFAFKFTQPIILEKAEFDVLAERLSGVVSTRVVCIGGNGIFNSLILYGLLSFQLEIPGGKKCYGSLEVKGLV